MGSFRWDYVYGMNLNISFFQKKNLFSMEVQVCILDFKKVIIMIIITYDFKKILCFWNIAKHLE